jgi:hypothetical protein
MRRYSNHSLINGAGAGIISPPALDKGHDMSEETIPTWGYRSGEAKLFELKPGEALPDGWSDAPVAVAEFAAVEAPAPVEDDKPKRRKAKAAEEAVEDANE